MRLRKAHLFIKNKLFILFLIFQGGMFYLYVLAHMCPVENIAPVVRPYGGKNDEKLWQLKFYKRQTRALHLILQSQIAKQKPATPRTIVVSKNVKTNEEIMVWAGGFGIPVEIVESEHMVHSTAEVVAWLKYIVENYENLPEHVVFLTDSGPDWHSKPDWSSRIKNAAPACREGENRHEPTPPPLITLTNGPNSSTTRFARRFALGSSRNHTS